MNRGNSSGTIADGLNTGQQKYDSDLVLDIQTRVWRSLKKGYEYSASPDESDRYLRENVFSKPEMAVLYVDLVGSTNMALELPTDRLATIISSFAQEMAYVVQKHDGYVLKFVGDAVIGYFVAGDDPATAIRNAVSCAVSMISAIVDGINPVLRQYDYPDLTVKIGLDYGRNIIIRYGGNADRSRVDIMGPVMSIAAKIQSMAKPNQILIGDDVMSRLDPEMRARFKKLTWKYDAWNYRSRLTGKIYDVYAYDADYTPNRPGHSTCS